MNRKSLYSWVLYDWASSAFTVTVISGFFPVFFKKTLSAGADVTESTLRLGTANSIASVVVALLAPVLGAIADRAGAKKKFLLMFALLGIAMTLALQWVERGQWEIGVFVYVMATIGFSSANSFYDSLLVSVAGGRRADYVSALGFAFGYLGGGLLFAFNVAMVMSPHSFGLQSSDQAVRLSFVAVAVWWAVFSIPFLLFVEEAPAATRRRRRAVAEGLAQLGRTFNDLKRLRMVFLFLVGYWFYIDGVDTITRMAVDYGLSLGFDAKNLIFALLITQFVGFPAAIVFGKVGEKKGAKTGIYIGIAGYIAVCVWAYRMNDVTEFYVLAVAVGLVLGGIQSLSRSFYSRIIPRDKAAEFFGFYNMLGKFAAVIGPVLMGTVGVLTHNPRAAILSVIVLLVAGGLILRRVNEDAAREAVRKLETA